MPWSIEKRDDEYVVINKETGDVKGHHKSKAKALAQMRALYVHVPESSKSMTIQDRLDLIRKAIREKFISRVPGAETYCYIDYIYDDYAVFHDDNSNSQQYYKVGYVINDDSSVTVGEKTPVEMNWITTAGKSLSLSYAKSLLTLPDADIISRLAVKSIGKDEIQAYTFLWGSPAQKDIERDYFTKETNFWDDILGKSARPLTWDHAQDSEFKASPVIGKIDEFGDDEVGRWYTAHLERAHKYRKAIDALIERGLLGSSSDSASQYVRKVKKGTSNFIATWPWFASALTDAPCEPRMLDEGKAAQFFKSLGVSLPVEPEAHGDHGRLNVERERIKLLKFYT
jgi:hypothetical protein